mmetsp:Transcript_4441/g.8640  ORF Transcript_4441/g.8640 Transcript_4441/m.8640 type:complete len:99 (-) Transcript_4441:469-765(-)
MIRFCESQNFVSMLFYLQAVPQLWTAPYQIFFDARFQERAHRRSSLLSFLLPASFLKHAGRFVSEDLVKLADPGPDVVVRPKIHVPQQIVALRKPQKV